MSPGKVTAVDVEVIAFDVFGTLVDWHTSITAALQEVGGRAGIDADWPAVAGVAGAAPPHPQPGRPRGAAIPVPGRPAPPDARRGGRPAAVADAERRRPGGTGPGLVPPGAVAGHRARPDPLRERHFLTPLSNGGMGLLTRLARTAELPFDCILSAELAGITSRPAGDHLVPGSFDVPPEKVMMVACHCSDLEAAAGRACDTWDCPPLEWGPGGSAPPPPGRRASVAAGDLLPRRPHLTCASFAAKGPR